MRRIIDICWRLCKQVPLLPITILSVIPLALLGEWKPWGEAAWDSWISQVGVDGLSAFNPGVGQWIVIALVAYTIVVTVRGMIDDLRHGHVGVVQGANYEDLRRHAAEQIASLDFDGVGIGGAIEKRIIGDTCAWICDAMPESRPRHVLGIAAVDDIFACVENGGDTFDCVAPARCGRNGAIFTRGGRYNIKRAQFKHDFGPLEEGCDCYTCTHYSRAYVDHALRAREFNGFTLATIHNEHFFVKLLDDIRASIDGGYFDEFRDETLARFYANGSRG
jgi:tRNA-guanine family transglycosylase